MSCAANPNILPGRKYFAYFRDNAVEAQGNLIVNATLDGNTITMGVLGPPVSK